MAVRKHEIKSLYGTIESDRTSRKAQRSAIIRLADLVIAKHLELNGLDRLGFGDSDLVEVARTVTASEIAVTPYSVVEFQTRSKLLSCEYKLIGGALVASRKFK